MKKRLTFFLTITLCIVFVFALTAITANAETASTKGDKKGDVLVTAFVDEAAEWVTSPEDPARPYIFIYLNGTDYGRESSNVDVTASYELLNYKDKITITVLNDDGTSTTKTLRAWVESKNPENFTCSINEKTRWESCAMKIPAIPDYAKVIAVNVEEGCEFPARVSKTGDCMDYYTVSAPFGSQNKGECRITDHIDPAFQWLGESDLAISIKILFFTVEGVDYGYTASGNTSNIVVNKATLHTLNYFDNIIINGKSLRKWYSELSEEAAKALTLQINEKTRWGCFSISIPNIPDYRDLRTVLVKEGCQIPAKNGVDYFVLKENYVWTHPDAVSGYQIPDGAVEIEETSSAISYTIKFSENNIEGAESFPVDLENILFNDKSIASINEEADYISASWQGGMVPKLLIKVDKDCPYLNNEDYDYVQNYFILKEHMKLPSLSGEESYLGKAYRLCVYDDEVLTEIYKEIDESKYQTTQVSGVTFTPDDGVGEVSARFLVTFSSPISNENIPAQGDYNILCPETWKENNWRDPNVYTKHVSLSFVHDGLKSSLFDNVIINGLSLAQWQAVADEYASSKPFAVAVHYGMYGNRTMTIDFTEECPSSRNAIIESYNDGSLTIEFREGLRFVNHRMVKESQKFVFRKSTNSFVPATTNENILVYYDGKAIKNGETVETYGLADKNSLYIPNDGKDYYVSFDTVNGLTNVTVYLNREKIFSFKVKKLD